MKKIFAITLAFLSFAIAQAQRISMALGGSTTTIMVINNTDTPIDVTIGNREGLALPGGKRFQNSFNDFTTRGDIPILMNVCSSASSEEGVNFPESWASDPTAEPFQLGALALTAEYLRSHPTNSSLDDRVKAIKKFVGKRPGGNDAKRHLDSWLKSVKKHGLIGQQNNCQSSFTIPAVALHYYNWYSGGCDRTAMVIISKNSAGQYALQRPNYIW